MDVDAPVVMNWALATTIVMVLGVFPWWVGFFTIIRWVLE